MKVTARDVARRALAMVAGGEFASQALDAAFFRSGLDERDRGLATELCYGVLRHQSRLDRALVACSKSGLSKVKKDVRIALRVAAYQLIFLERVPAHAAVNDAVGAVGKRGKSVKGFVNGVLRALVRDKEPPLPAPDDHRVFATSLNFSMPEALVAEVAAALPEGEDVFEACRALNEQAPLWLRPNSTGMSAQELCQSLGPGARIQANAVRYTGGGLPDQLPGFAEGGFTIQDLAAQWVGRIARPEVGSRVLDACAGVGGKTTHLAELVGPGGKVVAADLSPSKLEKMREAATRLSLSERIESLMGDVLDPAHELGSEFDAVLLDAPCTGIGVMRRHPEIKWRAPAELEKLVAIQRKMLERLAGCVRVGGSLTYSVCSFRPIEGAEQVAHFLGSHPTFELDIRGLEGVPLGRQQPGMLHAWPHLDDSDGFFAARLIRRA